MSHTIKVLGRIVYSRSINHLKHVSNCYNYSKDLIPKPSHPISAAQQTPPDYLFQNLKSSRNSEEILDLVGTHHKIMNSKQLLQALKSLYTLQKHGHSSSQSIMHHPNFDKLCYCLKKQSHDIELNEIIEALKVISYVGVTHNSTIVQVLLQLIRYNINELSLNHIIFLNFLLRQFKSSPLIDGLMIALPIVFEVNLKMKMDRRNAAHLCDYMHFISKQPSIEKSATLVVNNLNKCLTRGERLDGKTAKSLIWSICDMKENESFRPLLEKAISFLLSDINSLEQTEIQTTFTKLLSKYSSKFPFYCNEEFFDTYAKYIIDKDLGFSEAIFTLQRFQRIMYYHEDLLNYAIQKYVENSTVLSDNPQFPLYVFACAASLSEYKPKQFDVLIEEYVKPNLFSNYEKKDILWLKFASSLATLDIYVEDILLKAFNDGYLQTVFKNGFISDYESIVLINQAILTFKPELKHLLPPLEVFDYALAKVKPIEDFPLKASLEFALGGENYLTTDVTTDLGHQIDHAIVMRKGGYPVSILKRVSYLEDLKVPSDGHKVVVLALGKLQYSKNKRSLRATTALTIKTLEAKKCLVVPINIEVWEELQDFEKIPYIMQAIRQKTDSCDLESEIVC